MFEIGSDVIARSACDEAIHSFFVRQNGLLRSARNDGLSWCLKIESDILRTCSPLARMSEREIRGRRHVCSRMSRSLSSGGATRRPVGSSGLRSAPRHCEERSDEAIQNFRAYAMDCFVWLAMTLKTPCARRIQLSSNSPPARKSASVQIRSTLNQARRRISSPTHS
jgi:hypothetical protein